MAKFFSPNEEQHTVAFTDVVLCKGAPLCSGPVLRPRELHCQKVVLPNLNLLDLVHGVVVGADTRVVHGGETHDHWVADAALQHRHTLQSGHFLCIDARQVVTLHVPGKAQMYGCLCYACRRPPGNGRSLNRVKLACQTAAGVLLDARCCDNLDLMPRLLRERMRE